MSAMALPRISILLATYNRATFLDAAIRSVLTQSFSDWEIIIADDGSRDTTEEVAREWTLRDPRITYMKSEKNQGISRNYNMGFTVARGEYIAMIDDDDPWCDSKKLEKQATFLDAHSEYVGCGGGVIVINAEHEELYRYLKPESDSDIRKRMLFGNPMANSTTMFRRRAAESVGWYDPSIRMSGDRDFWLKMGLVGKLYNFPEYFTWYTMAGQNNSIMYLKDQVRTSLAVMKRYKGKYPHYYPALLINYLQYFYAFLPELLRKPIHQLLARLKRRVVG